MCGYLPLFDELLKIRQDRGRVQGLAETDCCMLGCPDDAWRNRNLYGEHYSPVIVYRIGKQKAQKYAGALPAKGGEGYPERGLTDGMANRTFI